MRANVIEAAEQCGILSLAEVAEPVALERFLGAREQTRLLVFCDEATRWRIRCRRCSRERPAPTRVDILIGPEGGFAEEERALLLRQPSGAAAFAGPAHPARGYRRRRRAGAGAGCLGRLARPGYRERPG